jgi:hypothetical protein
MPATLDLSPWTLISQQSHPTDNSDNLSIYKRKVQPTL